MTRGYPGYVFIAKASYLRDGNAIVRFTAYPAMAGQPRQIEHVLRANSGGTLTGNTIYLDGTRSDDSGDGLTPANAKKTLGAARDAVTSGGTIRIMSSGDYSTDTPASNKDVADYITIESDESLEASTVRIVGSSWIGSNTRGSLRPRISKLRCRRLMFDWHVISTLYPEVGHHYWLDEILHTDSDFETIYASAESFTAARPAGPNEQCFRSIDASTYFTGCTFWDTGYGVSAAVLATGNTFVRVLDVIRSTLLVAGNAGTDLTSPFGTASIHKDTAQYFGVFRNVVYAYNRMFDATHQGVFLGHNDTQEPFADFAFYNNIWETWDSHQSALEFDAGNLGDTTAASRHILYEFNTLSQNFYLRSDGNWAGNAIRLYGCDLRSVSGAIKEGMVVERCNISNGVPTGATDCTELTPAYLNAPENNFTPAPGQSLAVAPRLSDIRFDIDARPRAATTVVGAYAAQSEYGAKYPGLFNSPFRF